MHPEGEQEPEGGLFCAVSSQPLWLSLRHVQAGPVLRVACHHFCPLELETVGRQMVFLFFVSSYILSSKLRKSVWAGKAEYKLGPVCRPRNM